ncbi:hypothetical protein FKA31_17070 [Vibrio anguillarum]|nr:hypothetical protein [Vibrio anguillarum]NNN97683.1 hypothetical protein [Vibrio sp. B4-6]
MHNKAFKSDSQRLAVSLRSSIAKRRSHLNAALCFRDNLRNRNGFHLVGFSFGSCCNILLFRNIFEATG